MSTNTYSNIKSMLYLTLSMFRAVKQSIVFIPAPAQ